MSHGLRGTTIAIALLGSVAVAAAAGTGSYSGSSSGSAKKQHTAQMSSPSSGSAAQGQLSLTAAQKQTIARQLASEPPAAGSFSASVGAKVPASIALHPMPTAVEGQVPAVKDFSFAKLPNNDIILAHPSSRTVAEVIQAQPSTTGSAPMGSPSSSPSTSPGYK